MTEPQRRIWTPETIPQLVPVPSREVLTPFPMASDADFEEALTLLRRVVHNWAGDPGNAWAVSHGLQASGAHFKLLDGRNAVQGLFSDYAEEFGAGGHVFLRFPNMKGAVRVEPHTDQLLKIMSDVGVSPDTIVLVKGRKRRVRDLWYGSIVRSYIVPERNHASYGSTDDMGWSLQAIAAWAPPDFSWQAVDGTEMTLQAFTSYAHAVLITETRFLAEAMSRGQTVEKKGQGIFHYICGGAHLLQGVAFAIARGFGTEADRIAIRKQIPIWFFRYGQEMAHYDRMLQANPQHAIRLAVQRMAFTGHFVESMHKLAAYGIYLPDAGQRELVLNAARQASKAIHTLRELKVLDHMTSLRKQDEQLYLDVVGDSAHALFGLELALGRMAVRI